jgi:hypothetical protein
MRLLVVVAVDHISGQWDIALARLTTLVER